MAHIYHIAKTGSDQNAGTADAPFLTIQQAAELAQAGDRVVVMAKSLFLQDLNDILQ